jgi:hypothetical protein
VIGSGEALGLLDDGDCTMRISTVRGMRGLGRLRRSLLGLERGATGGAGASGDDVVLDLLQVWENRGHE